MSDRKGRPVSLKLYRATLAKSEATGVVWAQSKTQDETPATHGRDDLDRCVSCGASMGYVTVLGVCGTCEREAVRP